MEEHREKWRPEICSLTTAKAKGVFPNRIAWLADDPKIAGIVVFKSQRGDDYPLSQASVNYLSKGKTEGRVEEDFILFLRRGRMATSNSSTP